MLAGLQYNMMTAAACAHPAPDQGWDSLRAGWSWPIRCPRATVEALLSGRAGGVQKMRDPRGETLLW